MVRAASRSEAKLHKTSRPALPIRPHSFRSAHSPNSDPARNMARFYTMALQPTLFGDWALLREWGRIGSAGRLVSSRFASEEEAALAMAEHLKAKLSKGYEAV